MSAPITAAEAAEILVFLIDQGSKPPDSYDRPNGLMLAAEGYARLLTMAGVTLAEARNAAAAYVLDTDDSRFPTPWPSAGKLIARTPTARHLATFGGDLDAGMAWSDFDHRRRLLSRYGGPSQWRQVLVDPDPNRDAAMRFALDDTGGVSRWLDHPPTEAPHLERKWKDAYRAARRGQAADPEVRKALAVRACVALPLPVPEAK